jgi:hypothetical protein
MQATSLQLEMAQLRTKAKHAELSSVGIRKKQNSHDQFGKAG